MKGFLLRWNLSNADVNVLCSCGPSQYFTKENGRLIIYVAERIHTELTLLYLGAQKSWPISRSGLDSQKSSVRQYKSVHVSLSIQVFWYMFHCPEVSSAFFHRPQQLWHLLSSNNAKQPWTILEASVRLFYHLSLRKRHICHEHFLSLFQQGILQHKNLISLCAHDNCEILLQRLKITFTTK